MENQTTAAIDLSQSADDVSPFVPFIYGYFRAQAISDGVLVDVSVTAKEAGFNVPVALTSAAWSDCVEWSDRDSGRQTYQDESGRLWDVLWMAQLAARRAQGGIVVFPLYRVPRKVTLHMHIGPGDVAEPVIAVMMSGED